MDPAVRRYFLLNTAAIGPRRHVVSDMRPTIKVESLGAFKEDRGEIVPLSTVIGGAAGTGSADVTGAFAKKRIIVL